MSMEISVLSEERLNSIAEWQNAIDAERFPLHLADNLTFENMKGFMPAFLREKKTGFECYHVDPQDLIRTYDNIHFNREWKFSLAFVWGGDLAQMQAVWFAAAAYASATAGVVFDEQAGKILSANDALKVARDLIHRRIEM